MKTYETKQQFQANADQIWALITNPADSSWRSNVSHSEAQKDEYSETSSDTGYPTRYTDIQDIEAVSRTMNLTQIDGHGTRKFSLTSDGDNLTTLTITEEFDSHAGASVQTLLDQFLLQQQRTYLDDLLKKLGER